MEEINIREILKSKKGPLSKLPSFGYSLLEYIIKQKKINDVLKRYSEYEGVEFLNKLIEYLNVKVEIDGIENLPDEGRCFFVGNHAFGFIDGIIITKIVADRYGKIKFIGNEVFLMLPNLKEMATAVNMFDKSPKKYLLALNEVYESDFPVTHFPSGEVSRIYKWKIKDRFWHKSFITKALECQRNIVPIRFYGKNSRFFYFLFLFRRMFGIKSEVESILLPREFFNKRNKTIKLKIGKMIPYETFNNSKSVIEWAQEIKEQVYKL